MESSLRELREALSSCESTSPGEDCILYEMLKQLPEETKDFLLKIINKIWETGIMPKNWKVSLVIPIRKPNKDPFQATSYRPIALTSCVCKLMEKMVNSRLVWLLETKNLLSPFQFGFRKNKSTLDPLLLLTNKIQEGFARQLQTIGVFFDLEKAYDTTWRYGIIKQLHRLGIEGNMIRCNRYIKVRVGNKISSAYKQEEGVPQGSVLSVTCFALAINCIVDQISPPVMGSIFVDDFAIFITGHDASEVCHHLQKSINALSKWADDSGFKFSASKTVAVRFTRSTRQETVPTLKLKGEVIPYENKVKFLGMTFDSKLTWSSHIEALKIKVKKSLNILKVVSGFNWGADRKSLLRLYNALCRSKLDYGCQIYSSACRTKLKELDVVHNMGLRICSGAFRTSPIESIYVDTEEIPLYLRRQELGLRYLMRVKSGGIGNPVSKAIAQNDAWRFNNVRASRPFHIRMHNEIEDADIKEQTIEEICYSSIPPWLIPEPSVCSKYVNKKASSEQELKSKFLEHDRSHENSVKIYTDESKTAGGVGCAVVHKDGNGSGRMSNNASILTAELTAIEKALKVAYSTEGERDFTIYSDSFSSITAIKRYNSFNPIVRRIQEWLFRFASKYKNVKFCWVPAHVGIQGNETADLEAKAAIVNRGIGYRKVPHTHILI